MSDVRDIGKMFGLGQRPSASITTPDIVGAGLGWNITQVEDKFEKTVAMYRALPVPFTDPEILGRTFATLCGQEAALLGPTVLGVHEAHDYPLQWPSGRFYINSEIRVGQHRNIGAGGRYNFGSGGSDFRRLATNYKSIYGAQNNNFGNIFTTWNYTGESNLTVFPFSVGGGGEWAHHTTFEHMYFNGEEADGFRDSAYVSNGIMLFSPGEQSFIEKCRFDDFNDMGALVSHNPADTFINCSGFRNKVAIVGMRGCALSNNTIFRLSGDFQPYMLFQFRGGSDVFGTGPYMPHAIASNPGGMTNWFSMKSEDSDGRTGYPGYTGTSSSIGKGQMIARVTGRTYLTVYGGTASTYIGKTGAAVEIVDDFDEGFGGTPLDNSYVELNGIQTNRYAYYFHDWSGEKVFEANELSTFDKPLSARWDAIDNSRLAFYHKNKGQPNCAATSALHHGTQPFINDGEAVSFDYDNPPTHGYNAVTGQNYP